MTALARVVGLGAVTPVGLSAPATFAALRAGIARLSEIGSYAVEGDGAESEALVGGRVPLELFETLPEGEVSDFPGHRAFDLVSPPPLASFIDDGPDRLAKMLRPAIEEACADADWVGAERVEVWLSLDPADTDADSIRVLTEACARGLGDRGLAMAQLSVVDRGRAGALSCLEAATRALTAKRASRVLVAGVGSWIRPREAAHLDAFGNLRSAERPLGIHPGEGAAVVALERPGERPAQRRTVLASVHVTTETAQRGEPCDARALSDAMATALDRAGGPSPRPLVVCDLNGDRYRGLEWGLALVRALGAVHEDGDVWHPAEAIGDAGAGLGALVLAWAAHALEFDQAGVQRALAWAAAEDGARAACVLTRESSR